MGGDGGNETKALEAAGDCHSGFARLGCAAAGIKELAGQPLDAELRRVDQSEGRVTPRAQLYNSGQMKDYENVEEQKQPCWSPPSHMGNDVWSSQLGLKKPKGCGEE